MDNWGSNSEKEEKKTDGLFVPKRQASWVVAGLLFSYFTIFMSGYFWGKKEASQQFIHKIDQESFADQIYASLCSRYDSDMYGSDDIRSAIDTSSDVVADNDMPHESSPDPVVKYETQLEQKTVTVVSVPVQQMVDEQVSHNDANKKFRANLIGFGTQKAATVFAQRMEKKGILVFVKKRLSKTARGKQITWYQVVTEWYTSKNSLSTVVDRISKEERLQGASIITA